MNDFSGALSRANAFDTKVNSDASKISQDYASIVALSIRQALAATEITISRNSDGSFNVNDVIVFMKGSSADPTPRINTNGTCVEISSDGVRFGKFVY